MKRFMLLCAALVALVFVGVTPAHAADVTVTLSTHVPTASATAFTESAFPNISDGAYIRSITLANYEGASVQRVDLYRSATASHTATIEMTYVVPASTTVSIPIPSTRGWVLRDVGVKKSETGSTVKAHIVYE